MLKSLRLLVFPSLLTLLVVVNSFPVQAADIFWSTPTKINTSVNHSILPATITGPNGYLHTVWTEIDPSLSPGDQFFYSNNPGVYYSYWNGDAWSVPVKVSQNTGFAGFPSIAVTNDNVVHIVWEDDTPNASNSWGRILYSSSSNYGTSWSAPVSVAPSLDTHAGSWSWYPRLVKNSVNPLHLVFVYTDDALSLRGDSVLYYTNWDVSGWSAPQQVYSHPGGFTENVLDSSLAVDSSNNPHVLIYSVGMAGPTTQTTGIFYTTLSGGVWSTPVNLDPTGESPRLVLDSANNIHAIFTKFWFEQGNTANKNKVYFVTKTGGTWSSPLLITDQANTNSWNNQPITGITFDSNNNVYVGWGQRIGWGSNPVDPYHGVQVSYKKRTSGVWSDSVFMRYVYDMDTPFIYRDVWDNQHFAWIEQDQGTSKWALYYSTVPVNIGSYNPASNFSMALNITGDTLSIPSGSLATTATISAQVGPLPASVNPALTTISRSITYRPHGLTFISGKSATAVISYTNAEIAGADEKNLKVYVWDGTLNAGAGGWSTSYVTSVNTAQNKATVTLPHFSLYGMMAPKVKATWLPPISKSDFYQLTDGSTLPVKFTLNHMNDNSPLDPPEQEDDVQVVIRNKADISTLIKSYTFGTGPDSVRFDAASKQYMVNVHTKELKLEVGEYTVEVLIFGQDKPTDVTSFKLVEPGRVKGVSTP